MRPFRLTQVLIGTILISSLSYGQGSVTTKGKDFWLGFMKNYEIEPSDQLELLIVSEYATSGTVDVPGQGWSLSFSCEPNLTTSVIVPNDIAEVYSSQVIEQKGIHVSTNDSVTVLALNYNLGTAGAASILPTPIIGTNYVVASYAGIAGYGSELLIVATEDGTEIEITPSVNTELGDPSGVPFIITLEQGECYQLRAQSDQDLTATRIKGTPSNGICRPFAVFSGTDCAGLPVGCFACDHLFGQNFPIPLWGKEYYITPFVFELSSDWNVDIPNYTYRIMASEDSTTVVLDGGVPFILNEGEYVEYNYQEGPHCITSLNPIAVIQYMQGISCGGNGDPEMVILQDVSQRIDEVTFSTVESVIATSHYINMVIDEPDVGNVFLDGTAVDSAIWQPFSACPDQVWCGFEIAAGSHTLESSGGGLSAYIYGVGEAESYFYSLGSFNPGYPIIIDEVICSSDSITLELSGSYDSPYWYNYTSTPQDTLALGNSYTLPLPIQNGIYVGSTTELVSGCAMSSYFSVETPEPLLLDLTSSTEAICQGQSVQLNTIVYPESGVYFYDWTPQSSLDNPNSADPLAMPSEITTYTVTVNTPGGCATNTASITIDFLGELPGNILSVNGDILTAPDGISWQWYFNNQLLEGATTQTIDATQIGAYYVVTTNEYGCVSLSETVVITIGITESDSYELRIYPNPIQERAFVQLPEGNYYIRLLDATGKLAIDLGTHYNSFILERNGLASGKYQLVLSDSMASSYVNLIFE
jgi:hypothetical protein